MADFTPKYTIPFWRAGIPLDGELIGKHIFRTHVRFRPIDFLRASCDVPFTSESYLVLTYTEAGSDDNINLGLVTFNDGETDGDEGLIVPDLDLNYVDMFDGYTLRVHVLNFSDPTGASIAMTFLGERIAG